MLCEKVLIFVSSCPASGLGPTSGSGPGSAVTKACIDSTQGTDLCFLRNTVCHGMLAVSKKWQAIHVVTGDLLWVSWKQTSPTTVFIPVAADLLTQTETFAALLKVKTVLLLVATPFGAWLR